MPILEPASSLSANVVTQASTFTRTMPDGTVLRVFPGRSALGAGAAAAQGVQYHGGPIIQHAVMYAIFWQPAGSYMSPKYKPTIQAFFREAGGTSQFDLLTQYADRRFPVQNAESFGGAWTDSSPYPAAFTHGASGDAALHAEVLKAIAVNHWPDGGITPVFVIFTASGAPDDRWAACAYHASFVTARGGTPYVYSIVPYQHDYGPHGCGTPSNVWPNDRDADQTIDTLWHEEAESTTDPNTSAGGGAWYSDRTGAEIGDLCETSYGPLQPNGADTLLHGHP